MREYIRPQSLGLTVSLIADLDKFSTISENTTELKIFIDNYSTSGGILTEDGSRQLLAMLCAAQIQNLKSLTIKAANIGKAAIFINTPDLIARLPKSIASLNLDACTYDDTAENAIERDLPGVNVKWGQITKYRREENEKEVVPKSI